MRVAYLCNTFGQPDHDRCAALGSEGHDLLSIDWARADTVYRWETTEKAWNAHVTIPQGTEGTKLQFWAGVHRLVKRLAAFKPQLLIVYGYNNSAFFLAAILMRLFGAKVLTMNDSRFSDYRRPVWKDTVKALMLAPYHGCLAASAAAADYAWFLGLRRIAVYFCAVDTARIRDASRESYDTASFAERPFLIVSRFTEKKNLPRMLEAYASYAVRSPRPRRLKLIGYGPDEDDIRARVENSPVLREQVDVPGFVTASQVPIHIGAAFCLVLPSLSDQFGIVVTEALASGVPVLVSDNAGAAELVRPWVNGFIVRPLETEDIVRAMIQVDMMTETEWNACGLRAIESARAADVAVFVAGVDSVLTAPIQRVASSLP